MPRGENDNGGRVTNNLEAGFRVCYGDPMETYTIGQLARAASVATSTIRYYERVKLLGPRGRTEGNYRIYDDGALQRLHFIRAAQAHGFTLRDISMMVDFRDGKKSPCREVQVLIENRLADLENRIRQLYHLREVLTSSLEVCRRRRRPARCRVMDELQTGADGPRSGRKGRPGSTSVNIS